MSAQGPGDGVRWITSCPGPSLLIHVSGRQMRIELGAGGPGGRGDAGLRPRQAQTASSPGERRIQGVWTTGATMPAACSPAAGSRATWSSAPAMRWASTWTPAKRHLAQASATTSPRARLGVEAGSDASRTSYRERRAADGARARPRAWRTARPWPSTPIAEKAPAHGPSPAREHKRTRPTQVSALRGDVLGQPGAAGDESGAGAREGAGGRGHIRWAGTGWCKDEPAKSGRRWTPRPRGGRPGADLQRRHGHWPARPARWRRSGLLEKELPGFGELFRASRSREIGSAAMLSRAAPARSGDGGLRAAGLPQAVGWR